MKKTFLLIIKRQFLMNIKINIQCNCIMHLKPFKFLIKCTTIILDWIVNSIKSSIDLFLETWKICFL